MINDDRETAKALFANLQKNERQRTCGEEAALRYKNNHEHRFHKTLEICKQLVPNSYAHVLDVGPSYLTKLLAQEYAKVTTLGLDIANDDGGQRDDCTTSLSLPHITFELNTAQYPDRWPKVSQNFDLIVYAETIEHLTIAPEYSLVFLASLLAKDGILLVTTPNAVTIMKRFILLLKGKNPYERIRLFAENPGHYREYTMSELLDIGTRCQLDAVYTKHINFYISNNSIYGLLKNLRPTFGDSLAIAFRKQHP
jgi:2-polyprenyl-3-methyl-5-hydroxy-6-metoxy-1,4-benzoquinol methylase